MKYNKWISIFCLTASFCLTISTAAWAISAREQEGRPSEETKADDPVFVVPKVANPIPAEVVKDLQIVERNGRWLVSDKALQQYGIFSADEKKGTYWFRLPPSDTGSHEWQDQNVRLLLPGQSAGQERTINIRHVRRMLGISYVLGTDYNELLPPPERTRAVLQLQQGSELPKPVSPSRTQDGRMGLVLFWDPVMKEDESLAQLNTQQPVMSPCAFRLTRQGIDLRNPDFDMLEASYRDKGYAMWPLIDNDFDPQLTHEILMNGSLQDQIVRELIGYAILYDFKGYNIDFENVNYDDTDRLTAFVKKISDACRAYRLKISMDVTPLSDSPNWSLVYDRKALAPALDYVMVMAYDQFGRMSPVAGPVASYPWVERSVQNMLTLVPAEKIVLGMPLYMRIWYDSKDGQPLPQEIEQWRVVTNHTAQTAAASLLPGAVSVNLEMPAAVPEKGIGSSRPALTLDTAVKPGNGLRNKPKLQVRTLTMADSEVLMKKFKNYIQWDASLHLYKMELPLETGRVTVWFEDEKSLQEKIKLVSDYHLGGAAFWRKGFEPFRFWQGFAKHELT